MLTRVNRAWCCLNTRTTQLSIDAICNGFAINRWKWTGNWHFGVSLVNGCSRRRRASVAYQRDRADIEHSLNDIDNEMWRSSSDTIPITISTFHSASGRAIVLSKQLNYLSESSPPVFKQPEASAYAKVWKTKPNLTMGNFSYLTEGTSIKYSSTYWQLKDTCSTGSLNVSQLTRW